MTDDYLSYFTFTFKKSTNTLYYYLNGINYGSYNVNGVGENGDLFIGTCQNFCNNRDFHGKVYAFKWTNLFKSEDEIKATWNKSKTKYLI